MKNKYKVVALVPLEFSVEGNSDSKEAIESVKNIFEAWLFVGNRITRYLACCMVMSLAAAAQESHDFNRGRCQKLYGRPIQDVSRYETVINGLD